MKTRFSIGTKLIIMALIITLIGAAIGIVGIVSVNSESKLLDRIFSQNITAIEQISIIHSSILKTRLDILYHLLAESLPDKLNYEKDMEVRSIEFGNAIKEFKKTNLSDEDKTNVNELDNNFTIYKATAIKTLTLSKENKTEEALASTADLRPIYAKVETNLNKLIEGNDKEANDTNKEGRDLSTISFLILLTSIILGIIISMLLAFFISRGISKPITNYVSILSESSNQIGISSNQLSQSSQEIANGATEQAASIEETSSSMEELASMVRQNVENSKEASILADKSSEFSQVGFEHMEKMLISMNDINKSSDDIKNVIELIDDIAFQTNMLALNAAVEAARAGEAGMGFAVVADEVKNLANRSAESAKETSKMIKEIMIKIDNGLDISKKMADVFKDILTNSKKVSEMSKEVESASRQQDEGISQINKAIMQLDSVVQNNAGTSEETASAAEELLSQVESLNEIVEDLFLIITGKEFSMQIKAKKTNVSFQTKNSNFEKTVHTEKKPRLLAESIEKKENPELNKKERKISFEDDEEFKDMDTF